MKKMLSVLALVALATAGAHAAPSHITRNSNGGYVVTYNYKDKAKTGWYVGGRAELSFLNWKNKYSSDFGGVNSDADSDKYSFEPVFGGSLSFGRTINYFWRAEVEGGFIGSFDDKDNGAEFQMSIPYLMANGYYDFTNGLYVGAGLGLALPITELDDPIFESGDRTKTTVAPMAGVMLGYSHRLDTNLVFDVRYRLAGVFANSKQKRSWQEISDEQNYYFQNKIGLILDNSISVGLRYEF